MTEKFELPQQTIDVIAELTDSNYHTRSVEELAECIYELSEVLNESDYTFIFNALTIIRGMARLQNQNNDFTSKSANFIAFRNEILKGVLAIAKKLYENYDEIEKAF